MAEFKVALLDRLSVWREIFAGPRWKWLVAFPLGALALYQSIRDEFLPAVWQEKLKLPRLLPHLSWQTWALVFLSLLLIGALEGAYSIIKAARASKAHKGRDDLGLAYRRGMKLLQEKLQDAYSFPEWKLRVLDWGNDTGDLIERCYGTADRHLFENPDPGMAGYYSGSVNEAHNIARCTLNARIKTLPELIKRPTT